MSELALQINSTRPKLRRYKQARHAEVCRRAQIALEDWMAALV